MFIVLYHVSFGILVHYKQGLWYQSVTPRKPKAETFPGLTPCCVSNPMYIVITVNNHYITYIWKFTFGSKVNCTKVIHISYEQKRRVFGALRLHQKRSPSTCLTWTWEYKQFENQHKAGEFISGLVLKRTSFLSFLKKLLFKKIPCFLMKTV